MIRDVHSHEDTLFGRLAHWFDVRLGAAKFVRSKLNYVFPEHFSFLFGEIALYSFVVLVLTGTFLALFYNPSEQTVIYQGTYAPLRGVEVSEAYSSVLELSFTVRAGLLMRQTHHWAALIFVGAMFAHLSRVFFTGAYRRPREINWLTGVALLALGMLEGYAGYSLLDDLLSGTGVRIGYSMVEGTPVVGTWLAFLMFGGEYPGTEFLGRLFTVHIFILPAVLTGLIAIHLALIFRQHHTQFPGPGRTEDNVIGSRMWPTYATMSIGLFLLVSAVLVFMGGLLQINPVWLYGPYDDFVVSSGSQADWYVLWIQGALRLMPGVSIPLGPYTIANQFIPGVLFPLVVFALLALWPFLEAKVTGDHQAHHLLDRPRDRPVRTAIGTAALTSFAVLLWAGSDDVIAATYDWSIIAMRYTERAVLFAAPAVVGLVTCKVCRDLAARETHAAEEVEEGEEAAPPAASHAAGQDHWLGRVQERLVTLGVLGALGAAVVGRFRDRSTAG